jgi:dCMP deaminase
MKQKYIDLYMDWARRCAQLSHARRLQVGSVIVKDDSVISYGYNGMPSGWDNNCEDEIIVEQDEKFVKSLKTKPEVLHSESNAVSKLAKSSNSGAGADIFITHAPCLDCAKLIYQAGIKQVYFGTAYRDNLGVEFLKKSGIGVTQIDNQE